MPQNRPTSSAGGDPLVRPAVARAGTYAWKLIGIGIVGWAALQLVTALWVLLLAAAVAMLLGRALDPVASRLRRRGVPRALVAAVTLFGFLALLAGILALLAPPIVDEFGDLGPTLEDAVDDVEDWLVEDSPFDVSRRDVDDFRDEFGNRATDLLESESGTVVSGTVVAFEVITGLVLALVTTFFVLKDGDRFGEWVLGFLPDDRQPLARRMAARAWRTLGGYLRGSASLGTIEGIIIGMTVWLVGAPLAVPVGIITFFAAFLPFAGAIIAGAVAVLVTLVAAGFASAVVVLVVAVVVQQFDNDLLAPLVFGRSLELHPLVVLAAIVAGSTLFGAFGAVLAVPVSAMAINVLAEWRTGAAGGGDEAVGAGSPDAGGLSVPGPTEG
ncbi:MAG TPA: AI-2E family transporter [Acidimicrobiales bacterium]|nr:AI-2E family transporter [Acidimicrobiales bacterium]